MAVKYVKDFSFPADGGFHVQRYAKGGHVTKVPAKAADSAKGMPARAKPNAPARGAPKMESKPKMGKGQGYERGGGVERAMPMAEDVPLEMPVDRMAMRREMMGDRGEMRINPRMRAMLARRMAADRSGMVNPDRVPVFKKGGAVKGEKIAKVMREYKAGKLHSGSKKGPKVTNPKQAMAIALSEAGAAKKAGGGSMSSGPKTRYTPIKGRREAKERAMERRALDKARHAEKYAPGLSLDMAEYKKGGMAKHSDVKMDKAVVKTAVHKHEKAMHPGKPMTKLNKGGVPSYGRKPMYGGGKC